MPSPSAQEEQWIVMVITSQHFTSVHGWFFENRQTESVSVRLTTIGFFPKVSFIEGVLLTTLMYLLSKQSLICFEEIFPEQKYATFPIPNSLCRINGMGRNTKRVRRQTKF